MDPGASVWRCCQRNLQGWSWRRSASGNNTTSTIDTYDAHDRLTGETVTTNGSPTSTTTDTYDSNGLLIQSQTTIGSQTTTNTHSYDVRGRLLTAQVSGQTVSYTYDDDGNKIIFNLRLSAFICG